MHRDQVRILGEEEVWREPARVIGDYVVGTREVGHRVGETMERGSQCENPHQVHEANVAAAMVENGVHGCGVIGEKQNVLARPQMAECVPY